MTNQWDAWSAWGSDLQGGPHPIRTWKMGSGGASESHWDWEGGIRDLGLRDDEAGCWDLRAGWPRMGRQLLVPKGEKRTLSLYPDILKGVNTEEDQRHWRHHTISETFMTTSCIECC